MRRRSAVVATVLMGSALVVAGCGGGSGEARSATTAPPAGAPAPTGGTTGGTVAAAVPAAFAFEAPALGGGRVVGADYADTGVALWFWAPW